MEQFIQNLLIAGIAIMIIHGCKLNENTNHDSKSITLINPSDFARTDELITFSLEEIADHLKGENDNISFSLPFQFIDENDDGQFDHLQLLFDFGPNETKEIQLQDLVSQSAIDYPKRTQAEISHKVNGEWKDREYLGGNFMNVSHLKVPPEHTDHSWFIRYEGPGWESDKVGYRFYLDWRNATDIFGKKTPEMVLQNIGQDGFDSYHEPSDWGMDILKVGESLGIGAIGTWIEDKAERVAKTDSLDTKIIANGNIFSKVETHYHGWYINNEKIDLTSEISIQAGSRMTYEAVSFEGNMKNICTGIVKHPDAEMFEFSQDGKTGWGYIATYGRQTLNDDLLGMAVLFKNDDLIEITEDEHSHVVVLMPKHKSVDYYFLAAWELENDGIKNKDEFINYLNESIEKLNKPIEIKT